MKKETIPKDILERVELQLLNRERLLWVGKPEMSRHMRISPRRTSQWISIALCLEIAGLLAMLFASGGRVAGWLLLLSLMLLLFTAIVSDLVRRYLRANQSIYAISNERALIIEGNEVHSFGAASLQHIKRRNNDLIFKTEHVRRDNGAAYGLGWRDETIEEGFFGIENPEQVELLMIETFMRDDKSAGRFRLEEAEDSEIIENEAKVERLEDRSS
jgi:ABC-type multidrug transport system fused ATPase/permease subunit